MERELGNGFRVAPISKDDYHDFRAIFEPVIFPNRFDINAGLALTDQEHEGIRELRRNLGQTYELRLGVFKGKEPIGWTYGMQVGDDTFRMVTSGIRPEYQRHGIYSSLLPALAEHLKAKGFQIIFSRHYATDNQVIIPKLRFGFLISGFELTDEYGLLLRLSYFFNETRRKIMHVRSGFQQPDAQIRRLTRKYQ